jgi:beta-lactamase regulating signal transducer with metallopeptidase domain
MSLLLTLTFHGVAMLSTVWAINAFLAREGNAPGRAWWWWMVPLAFLCWIPLSVVPSAATASTTPLLATVLDHPGFLPQRLAAVAALDRDAVWFWIWLAGTVGCLLFALIQTWRVQHRWSRERLVTDGVLLGLLEDAKRDVGVTAPIGLIVSDDIVAPALLGWLRPRILLPGGLVRVLGQDEVRAILLHELAHFRALDIPLNWLFTLARAVHWFNPLAHVACRVWARYREETADVAALRILREPACYQAALIKSLRHASGERLPFGALAIGESFHHLKRRITMINRPPARSNRHLVRSAFLALFFALILFRIAEADSDPKQAAVAAMQVWLQEIDHGHYDQSWSDAASSFQKAITSSQWVAALKEARTPEGACLGRKLASAMEQTAVPSPTGTQQGDFVIAQFNSSFENLKYAVETVTFEKAPDGTWKAAGYYIKPGS